MKPIKHRSKINKASLSWFLCTLLFVYPGCGTWTGNPPGATDNGQAKTVPVSLSIIGSAPAAALINPSLPIVGKSGDRIGVFELTEARISIEEISLKLDKEDVETRDKFEGPYIVNLLSNEVIPSLASIILPVGEYKEMTFKIHKLDEGEVEGVDQQDPLMKQSIYLTGVYTPSGGSPVTVSLKTDVDEEFSLMKEGSLAPGVQVAEDATNQVIIAFRLAEWFNFNGFTYDFSDLSAADNQLDNDASEIGKQLRERIKENIKHSADFGKDEDGDGELNNEEDTDDSNDEENK